MPEDAENSRFCVDLRFQDELNQEKLSTDLREEFKSHGIQLSQNATVSVTNRDKEWVISSRTTYTVEKEGDRLSVSEDPDILVEEVEKRLAVKRGYAMRISRSGDVFVASGDFASWVFNACWPTCCPPCPPPHPIPRRNRLSENEGTE